MKRFILAAMLGVTLLSPGIQADETNVKEPEVSEPKPERTPLKENFGSRVSVEAKQFRTDEARTERNFGEWVSSQRSHRPARHHGQPDNAGHGKSDERGRSR